MEFTLAKRNLLNASDETECVQSKQRPRMYTNVDRLTRDGDVVNYKSHCHQIKFNPTT